MWTQIRLFLKEQSDLGLHCLLERLLKLFSRRQKHTTFVVIGILRVSVVLAISNTVLIKTCSGLLNIIRLHKSSYHD